MLTQRFTTGQPLNRRLPADDLNVLFNEVAPWWRQQTLNSTRPNLRTASLPAGVMIAKNASGAAVDAGCALVVNALDIDIDDVTSDEEYSLPSLVISGVEPNNTTAAHYGKWCIALQPIANNAWGPVQVHGLAVAKVTKDHVQHPYVDIDATSNGYKLATNWFGAGEILQITTSGGSDFALIRIGTWHAPIYDGVLSASLSAGSSANCTLWYAGAAASPSETITLHWDHMNVGSPTALASGTEVKCHFDRSKKQWTLDNAQC